MLHFGNSEALRDYLDTRIARRNEVHERLLDLTAPGHKRELLKEFKSLEKEIDTLRKRLSKTVTS